MKRLLVAGLLVAGCSNPNLPQSQCPVGETELGVHGCVVLYEDGGWVKYQGTTEVGTGCVSGWPCSE